MEAAHELARVEVVAKGVLELVAVAPLFERRHDRLDLKALKPAEPPQRVLGLPLLDLELALVGEHLPRHARVVGERGDPLGARLEHLQRAGVSVGALALVHERTHAVAGDGAGDEHHVTVLAQARHALAAVGERVDGQLELLAALGPSAHAEGPPAASGLTRNSNSAFCA